MIKPICYYRFCLNGSTYGEWRGSTKKIQTKLRGAQCTITTNNYLVFRKFRGLQHLETDMCFSTLVWNWLIGWINIRFWIDCFLPLCLFINCLKLKKTFSMLCIAVFYSKIRKAILMNWHTVFQILYRPQTWSKSLQLTRPEVYSSNSSISVSDLINKLGTGYDWLWCLVYIFHKVIWIFFNALASIVIAGKRLNTIKHESKFQGKI